MAKRVSILGDGQEVVVEVPFGTVRVTAGSGAAGGWDTISVVPHPVDAKHDGRVLLANVQDQGHTVRLVLLPDRPERVAAADLPEVVRQERETLVQRVFVALDEAVAEGREHSGRLVIDGRGLAPSRQLLAAVAAKVRW